MVTTGDLDEEMASGGLISGMHPALTTLDLNVVEFRNSSFRPIRNAKVLDFFFIRWMMSTWTIQGSRM